MLSSKILKDLLTVDDIKLVLDMLGIMYRQNGNKSLVALCPSPYHQDRKPSWDINIQKNTEKFGIHSCFSCGYSGDIIGLVKDVLNLDSRIKALQWLNDVLKKTVSEEYLYEKGISHKKAFIEIKKKKVLKFKVPDEFELIQKGDEYYKYLTGDKRGLTNSIIEKANLGKCLDGYYRKRVIVPIYFNEKLVFYFARNNDDINKVPKNKRGLYPKFSKSGNYLYPYDWLDFDLDYVYLVEGSFDALRMYSLGFKNVLCLFGNKISERQADLLKSFQNVILVPDHDGELNLEEGDSTKGMLMIQYAMKRLIHSHKVEIAWLPVGKDPGEATKSELTKAIENRKSIFKKHKKADVITYGIKKKCR